LRRYETIFITNPELSEEDQNVLQEKVRSIMANWKGEIIKIEDWGPRKLSYQIRKNSRGRYFLVDYLTEAPALVRELERTLRLNDGILKFLTVNTGVGLQTEQVQALKAAAQADKTIRVEERIPVVEVSPAPVESAKIDEGGEAK
jgi:small subunit ribosomal protein S6